MPFLGATDGVLWGSQVKARVSNAKHKKQGFGKL